MNIDEDDDNSGNINPSRGASTVSGVPHESGNETVVEMES